jgi:hypothetical protein
LFQLLLLAYSFSSFDSFLGKSLFLKINYKFPKVELWLFTMYQIELLG